MSNGLIVQNVSLTLPTSLTCNVGESIQNNDNMCVSCKAVVVGDT